MMNDELAYELGCGDARRCPSHPEVKTSSDNGMFDGPCWKCEQAMDEAMHEEASDSTYVTHFLSIIDGKLVVETSGRDIDNRAQWHEVRTMAQLQSLLTSDVSVLCSADIDDPRRVTKHPRVIAMCQWLRSSNRVR